MLDHENSKKWLEQAERLEFYRLRKSWGVIVINFAVFNLLTSLTFLITNLSIRYQYQIDLFEVSVFVFLLLLLFFFLASIFLPVYIYSRTPKTIITEIKLPYQTHYNLGLAMILLWFLGFFFQPIFSIILPFQSNLWTYGIALLFPYFLMKNLDISNGFRELLIIGLTLIILTIPLQFLILLTNETSEFFSDILHLLKEVDEFYFKEFIRKLIPFITAAIVSVLYIVSGLFSLREASKTLKGL